jgi:glycerol-3-phosphate dehydrogenase
MAEVITNRIVRRLRMWRPSRTQDYLLDGAPDGSWTEFECTTPRELARHHSISEAAATHLVRRYGKHAVDVVSYLQENAHLAQPVVAGEPDLRVEWVYQREHEMALFPEDHLLRRTRLGLFRPELGPESAPANS